MPVTISPNNAYIKYKISVIKIPKCSAEEIRWPIVIEVLTMMD